MNNKSLDWVLVGEGVCHFQALPRCLEHPWSFFFLNKTKNCRRRVCRNTGMFLSHAQSGDQRFCGSPEAKSVAMFSASVFITLPSWYKVLAAASLRSDSQTASGQQARWRHSSQPLRACTAAISRHRCVPHRTAALSLALSSLRSVHWHPLRGQEVS